DTELACLAAAQKALIARDAAQPSLRLANLLRLKHNLSVDVYADGVIAHAKLVIVRLLGGRGYWSYGVDRLVEICRERSIPVAPLVFYRALVQAADTAAVDAVVTALAARGLNPLPLFVQSLKDPQAQAILAEALTSAPPEIVLNATGFAVAAPGGAPIPSPF